MRNRRLHSSFSLHPSAFTLIELLVVIGIIALLASILFPVIGKVRESAREADTRALIQSIESAAQAYHQDHRAYPGPLAGAYVTAQDQTNFGLAPAGWRSSDTGIGTAASGSTPADPNGFNTARVEADGTVNEGERVTEAENLVLGLLGGVNVNKANANNFFLEYDAASVGTGPAILNPVRPGRTNAYMQKASLSAGYFEDEGFQRQERTPVTDTTYNAANLNPPKDSRIPEFVDRFNNPMPILVLRARTGARARSQTAPTAYDEKNNDVVVNLPSTDQDAVNGQYNLVEITPYTQSSIGVSRNLKQSSYVPSFDAKFPHGDPTKGQGLTGVDVTKGINKGVETIVYPYNAFAYLADPSSYDATKTVTSQKAKMKARKADQIILISAGRDRVYGTDDDIANFGSVK